MCIYLYPQVIDTKAMTSLLCMISLIEFCNSILVAILSFGMKANTNLKEIYTQNSKLNILTLVKYNKGRAVVNFLRQFKCIGSKPDHTFLNLVSDCHQTRHFFRIRILIIS